MLHSTWNDLSLWQCLWVLHHSRCLFFQVLLTFFLIYCSSSSWLLQMYCISLLFTIIRAPYACLTFILIHFMQFIHLTSFNSKLMYACCRVQLFKLLYYIMMKHCNYLWCSCCKVLFSKTPWPAIYLLPNLKGMFSVSVHDMFFYFIKTNIKLWDILSQMSIEDFKHHHTITQVLPSYFNML